METITIIIYLILFVVVLFMTREIVSWFWKINENIRLQEETNRLLKRIVDKLDSYDDNTSNKKTFDGVSDVNDPKILNDVIEILKRK